MDHLDTALERAIDAGQAVGSPTNPDRSVAYYPQHIRNQQIAGEGSRCFAGVKASLSVPCLFSDQLGIENCDCAVARASTEKGADTTQYADVQYASHIHAPREAPLKPAQAQELFTQYIDRLLLDQREDCATMLQQDGLPVIARRVCLGGCLADAQPRVDAGEVKKFLSKPS